MKNQRNQGEPLRHTEHARKPLLRRSGVAGLAHSGAFRGTGAPSVRLLGLTLVLAAALMALAASPASAKEIHVFSASFGTAGSGPGQLSEPSGLAVNESTGDVYVADTGNRRIDQFDESGNFIRAFGADVGGPGIDICTTSCLAGTATAGPGGFESPTFVAVDNAPLSPSHGDVYVADSGNGKVSKFEADGTLISAWGSGGQLDGSTATDGPFGTLLGGIAVDASGNLDVDQALHNEFSFIFRFAQDGTFIEDFTTPRSTEPFGLAVDPAGDFYKVNGDSTVEKLEVSGESMGQVSIFGALGSYGLAVDSGNGSLYVDRGTAIDNYVFNGSGEVIEPNGTCALNSASQGCNPTESFGFKHLEVGSGLAVNASTQTAYAADKGLARIAVFVGPVVVPDVETEAASEVEPHSATLNGSVDPLGAGEATCKFEWGTTKEFGQEAPCSASVPDGTGPVPVHAVISDLHSDITYFYRLQATNHNGTNPGEASQDHQFTTPGPGIRSTSVSEVSADSATLEATIDPHGAPTTYRFEYLTEAEFQQNLEEGPEGFSGAHAPTPVPVPDVALGSGEGDVEVTQHIQGLSATTTFHFRVVATAELGLGLFTEEIGADHAFNTQRATTTILPDHRAWELVSPSDKRGALLLPTGEQNGPVQAAAAGGAVTYPASAPTEAQPQGNANITQVLSARGNDGWQSRDLNPPHQALTGVSVGQGKEYRFFSTDLSHAVLQPFGPFEPSLSPEATEQTPFLRTNFPAANPASLCTSSCYQPLVTAANVSPPGTEFGEDRECTAEHAGTTKSSQCGPRFLGSSPDAARVVIESVPPLLEGAPPGQFDIAGTPFGSLYEWSAGHLTLISVLPGGEPADPAARLQLGSAFIPRDTVSADGSRVLWSEAVSDATGNERLFLRLNATAEPSQIVGPAVDGSQCTDPAMACTIELAALQGGTGGTGFPRYQLASTDGSRIFFTDASRLTADSTAALNAPDLYEYDLQRPVGQRLADLTANAIDPFEPAAVQGIVPGASADGSTLYFVAEGALAENVVDNGAGPEAAQPGQPNLYRYHEGTTAFIATLSGADSPDWAGTSRLTGLTSRVTPDGRFFAFMSQRPLTGYDNRDAVSGQPDQEVFLYHAPAAGEAKLVCASCNPTGARPRGREYGDESQHLLYGGSGVWDSTTWLAANVPGWNPTSLGYAHYQPRYLSDSGRLFFNSSDALLPADSNATVDVYQYEPPGLGTCTEAGPTYVAASGGCLDLISSGTSKEESAFLDASESGDDVFFFTNAQLSKRDADSALDVYDARAGGGEAEPAKPVECEGDGCQQPATPAIDATPGSLTFNGAGNLLQCPKGKVKRHGKCVRKHKAKKHHKKHKNSRRTNSNRGGAK